ncbi:hypothetical protein FY528_15210 [Hymenobacter lutimineralis]|uniref:Uncharacterized protein n=1 Tax=Hymenobacter lutimineralis TaxID=2606448 RepID=A0A5D6UWF3_9BACT|nr:hypothetical protein [Hymenobacter lutimineralis]TYZ07410.1 hypothetical protein FY528_15210 [Hymenobacter lutimineralis]
MSVYRKAEHTLKWLAYYQIIGGVLGIGLMFWLMVLSGYLTGGSLLALAVGFGLHSYSIYCGQQLLKGHTEKGLQLSMLNQALQVISFSVVGFGLEYVAGVSVLLGADFTAETKSIISASVSSYQVNFNSSGEETRLSVNLVALYIMRTIAAIQKKAAQAAEVAEYAAQQHAPH